MIKSMTKYSFVIFHEDVAEFVESLQRLGVMDLVRESKPIDERSRDLFDKIAECKGLLEKLKPFDSEAVDHSHDDIDSLFGYTLYPEELIVASRNLFAERKSLTAEISATKKRIEAAKNWGEFSQEDIKRIEALGYTPHFYVVSAKKGTAALEENYPVEVLNEVRDKKYIVLLAPKDEAVTIKGFQEAKLPSNSATTEALELASQEKKLQDIDNQLVNYSAKAYTLESYVSELTSKADLYLASKGSDKQAEDTIEIFTGFAPTECDEAVKKYLDSDSGIYYMSEAAAADDKPPIELKNNWFTRIFSALTDMYGRPAYNEFDPTPYISIFFMLFFAMCMGDAGYGIVLFIVGFALGKVKSMASFAPIVKVLGVATFIVGIILHTFMGINIAEVGWVPDGLKKIMITGKVAGYDAQMVLAIGVGIVHLCVAMVVKAVYTAKKVKLVNALGTVGWTLLIVGNVLALALWTVNLLSGAALKFTMIGISAVAALFIYFLNNLHRNPLINFGSGLWETYNTATGLLGDVLSYMRLYALGLAGGMLGNAFNNLGGMVLDGVSVPGLNYIVFGIIVILGHTLNLAMCALGAFVHPLRLNFLEFFKNSGYEGSGKAYKPLQKVV